MEVGAQRRHAVGALQLSGCSRVLMVTHGYSRVLTGTHGCSQVLTGTHGYSRVLTGAHGYSRVLTGAHGYSRVLTGTHGYSRVPAVVRRAGTTRRGCAATRRACTLQPAKEKKDIPHARGIAVGVQVVFDLHTLFLLSGVVTQARIIRVCGTRVRARTEANTNRARTHVGGAYTPPTTHVARARCAARPQGDAVLGKWTESFTVQAGARARAWVRARSRQCVREGAAHRLFFFQLLALSVCVRPSRARLVTRVGSRESPPPPQPLKRRRTEAAATGTQRCWAGT